MRSYLQLQHCATHWKYYQQQDPGGTHIVHYTSATVTDNVIIGNTSSNGGACGLSLGGHFNPYVANNLILNNYGGGIQLAIGSVAPS